MQKVPYNDQLAVSNEDFFPHLSLPGSAGKRLAAARAAGDSAAACAAVAQHFRTRSAPRWAFYMHGTAWMEIDGRGPLLEKADALLNHRFRNSWPPFEWSNCTDAQGHIDWKAAAQEMATSIPRATYVTELSTAFALTGNTQYPAKALEFIQSQVQQTPFVLEKDFEFDHDSHFGGFGHNCLATVYRVLRWIDFLYCGAFQTPGLFSDEQMVWFLRQIWFISMQHFRLVGDANRRDNHQLVSHGHGPLAIGTAFPEFSTSAQMVAQGKRVIAYHFGNNILDDGGYVEHSTKYQYHILYHYLHPQALALANGFKLFSAAQLRRLAKWVHLSVDACKPDGILAEFGDEFGGSLAYLFGTLAVPVMDAKLAACARALGYEPGKILSQSASALTRQFAQFQGGHPPRVGLSPYYDQVKNVKKPAAAALPFPPTHQYPLGGYTFFRSDWTSAADYLAVSNFTGDYVGHSHWDPMSFVLHTQGKTLIGDPATWIYDDQKKFHTPKNPARGYQYNMESHNCLLMDDDNMKSIQAMCHHCYWGGPAPRHGLGLFKAGGPIEVAEIWHDGYAPTRHRRFVIHIKNIGFALLDLLARKGLDLKPRQYSQLFHFEAGVEVDSQSPESGRPLRALAGDAACCIVPGADTQSFWRLWRDPYLEETYGVSLGRPAPWVAELTRHIQGPSAFVHFLITRPTIGGATPRADYLGNKPASTRHPQEDHYCADIVDLGGHGALLVASAPYGHGICTPRLETDAELAVALLDRAGQPTAWAMARGSCLRIAGQTLVDGKKREWTTS